LPRTPLRTVARVCSIATSQAYNDRYENTNGSFESKFKFNQEERVMNKATCTLIAAVAAFTLSGGAYAQNNTLATPTTVSPAAATTSGYGTPGVTSSDSGMRAGSPDSGQPNSATNSSTSLTNAPGSHNTLATPSTVSPAAQ
jgi:hypothetical protein